MTVNHDQLGRDRAREDVLAARPELGVVSDDELPEDGPLLDEPPRARRVVDERPPAVPAFDRREVYSDAQVHGVIVCDTPWQRARAWISELLTSRAEREEGQLELLLRAERELTRTNVVSVVSPKGGVGKTTCALLIGDVMASRLGLRAIVVDVNPDYGTLGLLAPDGMRSRRTLSDAIDDLDQIGSATELRAYVSRLPSGLHLMGAPADPRLMKALSPELYGRLTAFLGRFYELVVLDLGTGLTDPLAEFAIRCADQTVVVTTPEWVTASIVLGAMPHLTTEQGDHLTVVVNKAPVGRDDGNCQRVESEFRRQMIARHVTVPEDVQLRTMLDSGTYALEALGRPSRMAIKELGVAVAGHLV